MPNCDNEVLRNTVVEASANIARCDGSIWITAEQIAALINSQSELKTLTVENPSASEDIIAFYTASDITCTSISCVVRGSSGPSCTIRPVYGLDRSSATTEILTAPTTITNTTTGQVLTNFNDNTIPAGSWVIVETTATTGTVDELSVTFNYTFDSARTKIKTITVESPNPSEDIMAFFTDVAITISNIYGVVSGTTPTATIDPVHTTDRSAPGNAILSSPTVINNTTTGQNLTSFGDPTMPANSWVVLKTTATSGVVTELSLTFQYTVD